MWVVSPYNVGVWCRRPPGKNWLSKLKILVSKVPAAQFQATLQNPRLAPHLVLSLDLVLPQDRLDNSGMPSLHKINGVVAALYELLVIYQMLRVALLQQAAGTMAKLTSRRQWHPRTPDDCHLCRASRPVQAVDPVEVVPWR